MDLDCGDVSTVVGADLQHNVALEPSAGAIDMRHRNGATYGNGRGRRACGVTQSNNLDLRYAGIVSRGGGALAALLVLPEVVPKVLEGQAYRLEARRARRAITDNRRGGGCCPLAAVGVGHRLALGVAEVHQAQRPEHKVDLQVLGAADVELDRLHLLAVDVDLKHQVVLHGGPRRRREAHTVAHAEAVGLVGDGVVGHGHHLDDLVVVRVGAGREHRRAALLVASHQPRVP